MNISRVPLIICAFLFLNQAWDAHAGPREDFDRLVQEVQAAPTDDTLRERIIAAALALKPAPAVPTEARRHLARAQGAIELAKQPEDMHLAIEEMEKALRLAPWWAEGYYNLGVVQDKARRRRMGELTKAVELRVFASFEEDVRAGFLQVYPIADEHLIAALGLIARLGRFPLRTLDALHLAIAQGIHVRRLATADKTMAVAGKTIGLGVVRFF